MTAGFSGLETSARRAPCPAGASRETTPSKRADVVVVGGGLAGMMAAWTAARSGARVILADKARAGTSGPTAFAAGDILCWVPSEDNLQEWVDAYLEYGLGLNSASWVAALLQGNHILVQRLVSEGFPVETDADGRWVRRSGRGPLVRCVLAPMLQWQEALRARCLKRGVTLMDRVAVERVLVDGGRAIGVAGFDVRTGEFHALMAPAVILATGGCSYRGPFFGQQVVAGEGLMMALEAGASLAYMEYGNHYNVSLLRFPTYGQSKFMAHGGRYLNRHGEPFLTRREPGLGQRAVGNEAVRHMVEDVRAGNGPIYLDLSRFEEWELVRKLMPNLMLMLERAGVDLRRSPEPVIPAFTGTSNASAAGIMIDSQGQTTLPGLFAAGDCACKGLVVGACIGVTGVSLAWANLTGHLAASSALQYAGQGHRVGASPETLQHARQELFAPLRRSASGRPRDTLIELSRLMGRVDVSLLRHEERLGRALRRVRELKAALAEAAGASDLHELMLWHEAASSLACAEATLLSALSRRETRGGHYREDDPETDPLQASVILAGLADGRLEIRRSSVGEEAPALP